MRFAIYHNVIKPVKYIPHSATFAGHIAFSLTPFSNKSYENFGIYYYTKCCN